MKCQLCQLWTKTCHERENSFHRFSIYSFIFVWKAFTCHIIGWMKAKHQQNRKTCNFIIFNDNFHPISDAHEIEMLSYKFWYSSENPLGKCTFLHAHSTQVSLSLVIVTIFTFFFSFRMNFFVNAFIHFFKLLWKLF